MKKSFHFLLLFHLIFFNLLANTSERSKENQDFLNISILGPAVSDWAKDVFMETQDGVHYSLSTNLVNGTLKFRENSGWVNNWGGFTFPKGIGVYNGIDIQITTPGLYFISFNIATLEYNFELTGSSIDEIALQGVSTGFEAIKMSTEDGIHYSLKNQLINKGFLYIKDAKNNIKWGSYYFPSGIASKDLPLEINVTVGGYYNVSFNKISQIFNFELLESLSSVQVGITGSSIEQESIQMLTTDNQNYYLKNQILAKGTFSFKDLDINTKWSSNDFPSGTASYYKSALLIDAAGDYDIFYNVLNGEYTFNLNESLNPAAISLYDLTNGSTVLSELSTNDKILYAANNVSINAGYISFKYEDDLFANWGGLDFPKGKASLNYQTIQVKVGGIYNVTFNHLSKEYEFILVEEFPNLNPKEKIYLTGTAIIDSAYPLDNIPMETKDGIIYTLKNQLLHKGAIFFGGEGYPDLGVSSIPNGVAIMSVSNIDIDAFERGYYDITFNFETKEYTFQLINSIKARIFLTDEYQTNQVELELLNEADFSIKNIELYAGRKYVFDELDFVPFVSWGGNQYPTGTAVLKGSGFEVPEDGMYDVTFNYQTKIYSIKLSNPDKIRYGIHGSAIDGFVELVEKEGIFVIEDIYLREGVLYVVSSDLVEFPVVIVANKGLSTKEEPIYLKRFEITTPGYYTITHNIAEAETMLVEKSLNVPTLNFISSFKVFPNPVQDGKVYFLEPSDITVFDLFGRELLNRQEVNMLDVSGLSSGGYLLKNQKGQTTKLIVD
ncbi:T9SS type A sorting domain-containing protein [Flavobacterium sp. UBA7682]|uniref:T9SS type A sorting domain-containing protein n=1 Tax=Flavobacterium sp. UBA7682 TaxID=1946560 RepID=UPI0025C51B6E|nr:T9SS type A sorting domain-containing protein [Flavobacterium sp. UBA7682]